MQTSEKLKTCNTMKRVEPHQNFEETIQRVIIFNNVICIIFGDFIFSKIYFKFVY